MTDHSSPSGSNPTPDARSNPYVGSQGTGSSRFFTWMRSLGIVRQNGWIGGVCGGVAARVGIDPIIVRGIAVVIAVLGGPAFLLYAAAWALLPDAQGDIHLERLIRGHFDPPIIAIIVIALFSFLPFAQGFWWAGAQFWSGFSWISSAGRVLWTLLVIGLIVGIVIWAARSGRVPPTAPRAGSTSPTDAGGGAAYSGYAAAAPASTTTAPAASAGGSGLDGAGSDGAGSENAASDGATTTTGSPTADAAGAAGTAGGPNDEYADWRSRQEAWKADYAAWSAREADARAMRQQRSAEMRAQAQALAAEGEAARRARRAANPRTGAAYVGIALGAALVAGGVAGILAPSGLSVVVGLAIATLVIGASIVLAGALRRRSGFLSFVSILLLLGMLVVAAVPRDHALVLNYASYTDARSVSIAEPVGSADFLSLGSGPYEANVLQGAGNVWVEVPWDATVSLVVTQPTGHENVSFLKYKDGTDEVQPTVQTPVTVDGTTRTYLVGGDTTPNVSLDVSQLRGSVTVQFDRPSN